MNVLILTVLLSLALLGIFLFAYLTEGSKNRFKGVEQDALMPLREDENSTESSKNKDDSTTS